MESLLYTAGGFAWAAFISLLSSGRCLTAALFIPVLLTGGLAHRGYHRRQEGHVAQRRAERV